MEQIKYPIGKFSFSGTLTNDERKVCIDLIERAPAALRQAVAGLSEAQLDSPYRPEGWTLRQVVHHLADSHLNAYVRLKLALTEEHPTITAYDEALWAKEIDARSLPVDVSLSLLDALHKRWVTRLRSLKDEDFKRTLNHPESGTMSMDKLVSLYAWHGRHHTAHITSFRQRAGV